MQNGAWTVVAGVHSGGGMGSGGCVFEGGDGADEGLELLARDSSGAEEDGIRSG